MLLWGRTISCSHLLHSKELPQGSAADALNPDTKKVRGWSRTMRGRFVPTKVRRNPSTYQDGFDCGAFPSTDPSVSKDAKIRREPSDFSRLFRQLPSEEGSPFSLRPLMIRHITYPFHLNVPSAVRLRARGQMASLL